MLLLRRHDLREAERLLVQMDVAFLSAAAPWSPKAGRALERWRDQLLRCGTKRMC
jgi:hypothetical protein